MDIIIDILLDIYTELMFLVVPREKRGRKHRIFAGILAFLVTFGLLGLMCFGIVLIWEKQNLFGWIPLVVAVFLSALQIVGGIILYKRKNKKD
ncbi:MAG: hypothetical protein E7380_04575 [Clostridiales bacterium]|nr:hypothetical protein [Clostridiales bacterium]MBQ2769010.1 hypothetical protein [Clostridia bacterium]